MNKNFDFVYFCKVAYNYDEIEKYAAFKFTNVLEDPSSLFL